MAARFIFSLDCEGKWGGADRDSARLSFITRDRLQEAYSRILQVMDRQHFRATFGFVAALCLEPEDLRQQLGIMGDTMQYKGQDWLATVKHETARGEFGGWSAPELVRLVAAAGHHVASHGGVHIPYAESATSLDAIRHDIALIRGFYEGIGRLPDVLIFPRNIIGFRQALSEIGFRGYRDIDFGERAGGPSGKLMRLANEVFNLDVGDTVRHAYRVEDGMTVLSPAKFFNARIGVRKCISPAMTHRRTVALIEHAVRHEGVVHLYTHPHNFISDPSQYQKLERLLSTVRGYVGEGKLEVRTMEEELHERTC